MFHLCLSLAHLLTLCHIEATSRRRTDPPALQGYHHSPPPSSPVISSAFALWANAELYILVPSLTYLLTPSLSPFLSHSGRKLEKSVNIDARTLKFCMSHPWTQSLRFRENQDRLSCLTGLPSFSSTSQPFN